MSVEILSKYVHDLWCSWAGELMEEEKLSRKRQDRWGKCFFPYEELPECEKDKDRKIAQEILDIIKKGEKK